MPRKPETLPANFADLLQNASLEELKAVFATRMLDAYETFGKGTALSFDHCPHSLAEWLIAQGANLEAEDRWGRTPLQKRAGSHSGNITSLLKLGASVHHKNDSTGTVLHSAAAGHIAKNFRLLMEAGADPTSQNADGLTALELALRTCSNMDIPETVEIAKRSLKSNPRINEKMQGYVQEIGQKFEFFRSAFNPDMVDRVSTKLEELYVLFEVDPTPRKVLHDGQATIHIEGEDWSEQYDFLWDLLVPATGAAATVQGEAIRIVGRIDQELQDNGGINWDHDFNRMAESFAGFIQLGNPLPLEDMQLLQKNAKLLKQKRADSSLLKKLLVKWIQLNKEPIPLLEVPYKR